MKEKHIVMLKHKKDIASLTAKKVETEKGENADTHDYLPSKNFLHWMCIAACIYQSVELFVKIRGSIE